MKISPLGDGALTIDFGNAISLDLNSRAISLAERINSNPFAGFVESVPAYASVSVHYDVSEVRRAFPEFPTAFDAVKQLVMSAALENGDTRDHETRVIEIPVNFGDDAALDLDAVAEFSGLERQAVIDLFLSTTYRVYMLGFLPGFAYMGTVDDRIAIPRRSTPRKSVPKGSVGIAGNQTGIYPLESPGGWQVIGRTSLEMFTPDGESPCLLRPGDEVRFVSSKE